MNDEIGLSPTAPPTLSRRTLLKATGVSGAALAAAPLLPASPGRAAIPAARTPGMRLRHPPAGIAAPPVEGLHLAFGADPSRQMLVSWITYEAVRNPRVMLGTLHDGFGHTSPAVTRSYTDGASGRVVDVHTALLDRLAPDHDYVYAAVHDGAQAELGTFTTAPRGRRAFRFTSYGDSAAPGVVRPSADGSVQWLNDAFGTTWTADIVDGVERAAPLFNFINGDLCYANLSVDRLAIWRSFLTNTSRSARSRPWMPAAGNHENEHGNGPIGFNAFQAYFPVPGNGGDAETEGLWYAFTVGSVRFVVLQNDDVALQDGGQSYVHGYSGGAQRRWLESELAAASRDRDVDWIVVCMHQTAISTADNFNGADLGVRAEWLPLFDTYGVDLVVCGHEHHYERSHPVRGALDNETRTPIPQETRTDVVDTSLGTVHMVLGGGGTSIPSNQLLTPDKRCRVITAVGPADPTTGKRPPVYVWEDAIWSAARDGAHSYGFAAFDVDPGDHPGGVTSIDVTYYDLVGAMGQLAPFDSFRLTKRRADH